MTVWLNCPAVRVASRCRCACYAFCLLLWLYGSAIAQTQNTDPRDRQIEQLLTRVAELERKLNNLETRSSPILAPVPLAAGNEGKPGTGLSDSDSGLEAVRDHQLFPNLTFSGFGDVQYRYSDAAGVNNAFALGQFELFPMSRLSENLSAFAEVVFSYGSDNKAVSAMERVLVQYTPNDYFNLSIGRYHTSLGYYNSAYHHGAWLQTMVGRPLIYNAAVVFPVHNTGLSLSGNIPSGRAGLSYVVEVGNGRHYGTRTEEANQSVTDDNAYKSVNVGLLARPSWFKGLELGTSLYHDTLTPSGKPAIDQFILVTHAVYKAKPWEILNEFMLYRHDPRGGLPATYTPGFYSQLGYQIGRFTPYVRYDLQDAPRSDLIFRNFGTVDRQSGITVGARFDFSDFVAFKLQYGRVVRENQPTVNTITAQLAYTF